MTDATLDPPLATLTRDELAVLVREWLLHGHLQDRVGIPLLYEQGVEREEAEQVAIDEWMAASPVYSVRMQELLGFRGSTVEVILKNIQLDIGAPPQFMDFRMKVIDDDHGEFWLDHCGALMDVEPMGDEWVRGMCHTIEDPTFDATALATNPKAAVRPIHRPPRVPTDRHPHCHWTVTVDPGHETPEPHPNQAVVERSIVAQAPVVRPATVEDPDGLVDYAGPCDPDLRFEDFSREALLAILPEVARQSHLLMRGYLLSVAQRVSPEAASALGPRVLAGIAPVTAGRLAAAFGVERHRRRRRSHGCSRCTRPSSRRATSTRACGWSTTTRCGSRSARRTSSRRATTTPGSPDSAPTADRAIDALARALDPRGAARPVPTEGDERFAYELTVDDDGHAPHEEPETALARFSSAADVRVPLELRRYSGLTASSWSGASTTRRNRPRPVFSIRTGASRSSSRRLRRINRLSRLSRYSGRSSVGSSRTSRLVNSSRPSVTYWLTAGTRGSGPRRP